MLHLTSATDLLQVVTGSIGAIGVHASMDDSGEPGRNNPASITTAATTTVVTGPASARPWRRVRFLVVRNNHASTSNLVTVQLTDGTTVAVLWKGTLLAGEQVTLTDSGWQVLDSNGTAKLSTGKLDAWVQAPADVTNATTAFADVTGLTVAVKNGKKYMFEAHLVHVTNANTTGAQFGVNGPAGTFLVQTIAAVTPDVAAGGVTAVDTAAVAETTGPGAVPALAILTGHLEPSADGTFAVRCASEVAIAGGLVVKAGSWLHVRELDN